MLVSRAALAAMASLCLVLSACSDPEKEANTLLVEASNLVRSSSDADPVHAWTLLRDADGKLTRLTSSEFASTGAAVRVASGEKIGGKSIDEIKAAIRTASASRQVCATLRTPQCAEAFVRRTALDAARSPKTAIAALAIAMRLQAGGLTPAANEIFDAIAAASPNANARQRLSRISLSLAKRTIPFVLKDKGIDGVRAFLEALVAKAPMEAQSDMRTTLLQEATRHLDAVGKPSETVGFVKAIQSAKDRSSVAETILRANVPYKPAERGRIDSLFVPLYPELDANTKKSIAYSWANHADARQHATMMALAETPDAKEGVAFAYLANQHAELTTAELTALLTEVAPRSRWGFQDRYLRIAIAHRKDAAERARALAAAKASVETGNARQVVSQQAAYRITETLSADDFSDAKLDQLTQSYLVPPQEGGWYQLCNKAPRILVQTDHAASLPRLTAACLSAFEKLGPDASLLEHLSVAALAGSAIDADATLYDRVKAMIDAKGMWYPSASEIRDVLRDKKADAAYAAFCADPKLPAKTQEDCREARKGKAIDAGPKEAMQQWDVVASSGSLPYALRVPAEHTLWKPGRKALFDRLIREKPSLVLDYLQADLNTIDPAVMRLDPDEILALLPSAKAGLLHEMLIQSAILNHAVERADFDQGLVWTADNDMTFALRLSAMLASGAIKSKDERAAN